MTRFSVFPKNLVLAVIYLHSRGWHTLRSRAIGAPVDVAAPAVNALYLYESSGNFRQHQLVTSLNARISPRISFNGSYTLGRAGSDTDRGSDLPFRLVQCPS